MNDGLVMTYDETAAALQISVDLVGELVRRGELPALQLGRRRLVPRAAIDQLLERAMAGFDPDRLVNALAISEPSSSGPADARSFSFLGTAAGDQGSERGTTEHAAREATDGHPRRQRQLGRPTHAAG